ncbi:MAG: IS21 family transposase [Candidatus Thorarchaeota archaeon]
MIPQERSIMIRHFVREGMSKAKVARQFGVCRQTVYNHVNRQGSYKKPRKQRRSKLDPFKGYIRSRLERFDLPATVLYREISERGYEGGYTMVGCFVRRVKRAKVTKLTERFETEPGRQAQIDFAECGVITVDGRPRKLYLFSLVLGFSRMLWGRFLISTKQPELLRCLKEAFSALGIPREVLIDNMKQAVERHDVTTGTVRFNRTFLDFAEHYGFLPIAAPPYWPRIKGKVERVIDYVKRSFLCGRQFTDLEDLNRQFTLWQDTVANVRVHGTTGRQPVQLYRQEMKHLRSSEAIPVYDSRPAQIRKAGRDSHIRYCGVFYSVAPSAAGRPVVVRPQGERLGDHFEVYCGQKLVAVHYRRAGGTHRVTLPEHAAQIRRLTRGKRPRRGGSSAVEFEQIGVAYPAVEVQTRSLAVYESLVGVKP